MSDAFDRLDAAEDRESRRKHTRQSYAISPKGLSSHSRARFKSDGVAGYPLHGDVPSKPEDGLCECCRQEPGARGLNADHDHSKHCDNFRAWLCTQCNVGFGMFGDTVEGLGRALAFLRSRS